VDSTKDFASELGFLDATEGVMVVDVEQRCWPVSIEVGIEIENVRREQSGRSCSLPVQMIEMDDKTGQVGSINQRAI
jgi:hypothetical protein